MINPYYQTYMLSYRFPNQPESSNKLHKASEYAAKAGSLAYRGATRSWNFLKDLWQDPSPPLKVSEVVPETTDTAAPAQPNKRQSK